MKSLIGVLVFAFGLSAHAEGMGLTVCKLKLDEKSVQVGWTAFKTTKKLAVAGKFMRTQIVHKGKVDAYNLEEMLSGYVLNVDMSSVSTENPDRDKNLSYYFFEKFKNHKKVVGMLKKVKDGKALLRLTLNGRSREVPVTYKHKGEGEFVINGKIDVLEFGAAKPLKALNEACNDLHKGEDGVSKTWSEVELAITGKFQGC